MSTATTFIPFALPPAYPPSIIRAADRATDCRIPAISALKAHARLLLQAVVRSIQTKDITNSVRVSNEFFAQVLHVSVDKVCKIKKELEDKEWITRSQVQSRKLGMQVSDVCLTPWALQTLGLVSTTTADHPDMPIPNEDQIAIRAAVVPEPTQPQRVKVKISPQPIPAAQAPIADAPSIEGVPVVEDAPTIETAPVVATEEPHSQAAYYANNDVPDDLMLLKNLGLRVSAIRKLMGMASKAGLMLGHIVEVAEAAITKARNPYAYIMKLLSGNIDWQGRLAAKRQKEQQQQEAVAQKELTDEDANTLRQTLAETGLLSSEKRFYVWRWNQESSVLERASIEDAVCNPVLAKWSVVLDTRPIAQAIHDGAVFAVTMKKLQQWQMAESDDESVEPLVFTPEATPSIPTPTPTPTPASQVIVQAPIEEDEGCVHPWHGTHVATDMNALYAAASASPQQWLCNPSKKIWLFRMDSDWLRIAKVQAVHSSEPSKVQWLTVPPDEIPKIAKLVQEGVIIAVDKTTVQSWCPSQQPQHETVTPVATQATRATGSFRQGIEHLATAPCTRQSGWQGLGGVLDSITPA